jgi:two-component system response regulator
LSADFDSFRVLLVEDNPADVMLLQEVFGQLRLRLDLAVAHDGVEAMQFLYREKPLQSAKAPHLVLLDLNLPRKNGIEVLAEIKADPLLKIIPVIVLTSSGSSEDILKSYSLGANTYLKKASSYDDTCNLISSIQHFWLHFAVLPTRLEKAW